MRRGLLAGAGAAAGVFVTHLVTFTFATPDGHARTELLHRTGHTAPVVASAVALGVVVAAFAGFVPMRRPAVQLVAVQSSGWLAVEAFERLSHPGAEWRLEVVALGLAVQAVVAIAAAVLVFAVRGALALVARTRHAWSFTPARSRSRLLAATHARPALLAGASGLRGPPYGP
ncbi:MAG TPA: hypothetical protein VF230_19000 [Acidimicrobiales bacterium]